MRKDNAATQRDLFETCFLLVMFTIKSTSGFASLLRLLRKIRYNLFCRFVEVVMRIKLKVQSPQNSELDKNFPQLFLFIFLICKENVTAH